ncbi:MAG: hypothetical protein ACOZAN_04190 [Patescibacteria group bacterium]
MTKKFQPEPLDKQKLVLFVIISVCVLLLIGSVYYLKSKTNIKSVVQNNSTPKLATDTRNWKVYENPSFGYSIKLPSDFHFVKTDGSTDVEMVTITSPDKSFSVNLQASRSYTVMKDWVKGVFGTTYVDQIKVNGDESSLLRINDNNYPINNTYTVGFYVYRNPIFYQLYSQQLKPTHVELFKTIASTFKTQQIANEFDITTNNPQRSNTLFNLTSSNTTSKVNWNKFTNSSYQMTVSYPSGWNAINLPKNYDNPPTFEISTNTTYKSAQSEKRKVWLRIGDFQQFSTAGGVCYNQICEEVGKARVSIKGKQYSTSIIRASSNRYGDPKQNVFGYYAFQFELTDKGYSIKGYSEPFKPAITAYFYTKEEGQSIVDMISTIVY